MVGGLGRVGGERLGGVVVVSVLIEHPGPQEEGFVKHGVECERLLQGGLRSLRVGRHLRHCQKHVVVGRTR